MPYRLLETEYLGIQTPRLLPAIFIFGCGLADHEVVFEEIGAEHNNSALICV
jgi:hypothetical protein